MKKVVTTKYLMIKKITDKNLSMEKYQSIKQKLSTDFTENLSLTNIFVNNRSIEKNHY